MFDIPLFPERASTLAGEVDALYFFLVGLSGFFAVLIATLIVAFAIVFRRRHADEVGARCMAACCSKWDGRSFRF